MANHPNILDRSTDAWVNALSSGAIGDNTADDTAALQLAINSAIASKRSLFIPAGTYKLTDELVVSAAIQICGDGPIATRLRQTNSSSNGIRFTGGQDSAAVSSIGLYGTALGNALGDPCGEASGTATGHGIKIDTYPSATDSVRVENVWAWGWDSGFRATDLSNSVIIGCDFSGNLTHCAYVDGNSNSNTIVSMGMFFSPTGLRISSGRSWVVNGGDYGGPGQINSILLDGACCVETHGLNFEGYEAGSIVKATDNAVQLFMHTPRFTKYGVECLACVEQAAECNVFILGAGKIGYDAATPLLKTGVGYVAATIQCGANRVDLYQGDTLTDSVTDISWTSTDFRVASGKSFILGYTSGNPFTGTFGGGLRMRGIPSFSSQVILATDAINGKDFGFGVETSEGSNHFVFPIFHDYNNNRTHIGHTTEDAPAGASTFNVEAGDVEVSHLGSGFILKSPDGTRYRIKVANGGALSTTAL